MGLFGTSIEEDLARIQQQKERAAANAQQAVVDAIQNQANRFDEIRQFTRCLGYAQGFQGLKISYKLLATLLHQKFREPGASWEVTYVAGHKEGRRRYNELLREALACGETRAPSLPRHPEMQGVNFDTGKITPEAQTYDEPNSIADHANAAVHRE